MVGSQLRNISGLAKKSLIGSKFGFENFGSLAQKPPRGKAFFRSNQLIREFPFNFEHERASHAKKKKSKQNQASSIRK